ncbi:MAG: class I fructose-bisphosphate aldolase [Lewinella sp.]|nr:class I fructose-bisphosphate aldolase [Lewinella sp.]
MLTFEKITQLLGDHATYLLEHECRRIPKQALQLPEPDYLDQVFVHSNRSPQVLRSLAQLFGHGNLKGTGYLSILPIDQGIEHSAAFSFYKNPAYFKPENIVRLAIEGGCNAVASSFGVLAITSRKYAHKIPFIVKLNHNQLLTYPNKYDQTLFGTVREAWNLGAVAVGATVYFGSEESDRQLREIAEAFAEAHDLGMATILWCYTRNDAFKTAQQDYHAAADLTGQANHLGVTIQADLIKQKLPTTDHGFRDLQFGKYNEDMYERLVTGHPIDQCRFQVANCYLGEIGLINSGGGSAGEHDLAEAVKTAVINKRAGGMGLILGRKAFQRSMQSGVEIIQAVQQVYLEKKVTIA